MSRLQESLHFIDDDGLDDEDGLMGFSDEEVNDQAEKPKKSNHVVFVDTEEDGKNQQSSRQLNWTCSSASAYLISAFLVKKFSPANYLNTLPELVNRKFNRPTVETLKKNVIAHAPDTAGDDKVRFPAVQSKTYYARQVVTILMVVQ
jgi:U3 small nucleolar RNA-associated protein 11